ncbi:ABC-type transport auxiliary lipoprotein family protein [Sphingomonas sp. HMP6]|uniref:ABC-type transport auxiliary lipoprotein family protein n=1 Tax=Sphingomonas sp. HMP6 TaxID=1517551 RepID=UPI001596B542|nr:ABC-type transport auxiliary lipoprotein family protein [Sphingomonas sp. HMP6]
MTMIRSKTLLALVAFAPLAGCISFGAKPPPSLLSLSSAVSVPAGQTQSSATAPTITILVPGAAQAIAGTRVPVQASQTSIAYVANAQWVEPPNRMFVRLLIDTVPAKTGRIVLSSSQSFSDPGAILSGELRNFGVDAGTNEAVVTFDGSLIRTSGKVVEKRRFEARVPVGAIAAAPVGIALNKAANTVAGEIADWVGK